MPTKRLSNKRVYRPGNYNIFGPDEHSEGDSFMCAHCNVIIFVQPSHSTKLWSPSVEIARIGLPPKPRSAHKRTRGLCFRCMAPTCGSPKCLHCIPWEAKLEAQEGSRRFWKDVDLALTGKRRR